MFSLRSNTSKPGRYTKKMKKSISVLVVILVILSLFTSYELFISSNRYRPKPLQAKNICKQYYLSLYMEREENEDSFNLNELGNKEVKNLVNYISELSQKSDISDVPFLVKTKDIKIKNEDKSPIILIVSQYPFPMNPQNLVFKGPYKHVMSLSNGYTDYIDQDTYKNLDKTIYRDIRKLK